MMSLHVILKPSCADTRFCPSLCCVAEPVVCPWGGLPVHRRDGKGGLGRHQRAPSARGGAGRPKWEGEGRMAYMPEVRNGLPTCRAVLSGASHHGRRREGRRGGRPGGSWCVVPRIERPKITRARQQKHNEPHGDVSHGAESHGDVSRGDGRVATGRVAAVAWRRVPAGGSLF